MERGVCVERGVCSTTIRSTGFFSGKCLGPQEPVLEKFGTELKFLFSYKAVCGPSLECK